MSEQLEEQMKKAKDLPHLLAIPDAESNLNTQGRMSADLMDTDLCMRLGRAFLQGRLDRWAHEQNGGPKASVDPPFPTREENDLYAGGYQYDFHINGTIDHGDEPVFPQDDTVPKLIELRGQLSELDELMTNEGLTLERVKAHNDIAVQVCMTMLNGVSQRVNKLLNLAMQVTGASLERRPQAPPSTPTSD